MYDIVKAQVQHMRPDVILSQAMDDIPNDFMRRLRPHTRLIVGQHAAPIRQVEGLDVFDLIVSSMPDLVTYYRSKGLRAELQRLAFDKRVLDRVVSRPPRIGVAFVGQLGGDHAGRREWLDWLCQRIDIDVWGPGADALPPSSAIRKRHRGKTWGVDMYQSLRDSRITLNHHIDMAGRFANNLRLYEATGVGSCLLTDRKDNLKEIFEVGREVIDYEGPEECLEKIRHYLKHEEEREAVARGGQQRTLAQHSYVHRMQELVDLVRKHL